MKKAYLIQQPKTATTSAVDYYRVIEVIGNSINEKVLPTHRVSAETKSMAVKVKL